MGDRERVYYGGYGDSLDSITARLQGAAVLSVFVDDEGARIETDRGTLQFYHEQDCCERVTLEDGGDELLDIVGKVIMAVEEVSSDGVEPPQREWPPDSYTWTFYRIITSGDDVTLRWFGESNGYYSESVSVSWTPGGEDEEDAACDEDAT